METVGAIAPQNALVLAGDLGLLISHVIPADCGAALES